jgi:hypothetical protein
MHYFGVHFVFSVVEEGWAEPPNGDYLMGSQNQGFSI